MVSRLYRGQSSRSQPPNQYTEKCPTRLVCIQLFLLVDTVVPILMAFLIPFGKIPGLQASFIA
jgi:hypothetical protein